MQPKKTNVNVFKKRLKLKKNERGHKGGHNLEVVSEITYFGVKLESTGSWRRQKVKIKT
jgi:hypothetical protein